MFDAFYTLSEGNPGALRVLMELMNSGPSGFLEVLGLDSRHLYGHHIWQVYKDVCGEDLARFRYHIQMELPCQICGSVAITGPYAAGLGFGEESRKFFAARKFWKPGSYWGLENPPDNPNYRYPLTLDGKEPVVVKVARWKFSLASFEAMILGKNPRARRGFLDSLYARVIGGDIHGMETDDIKGLAGLLRKYGFIPHARKLMYHPCLLGSGAA
jgi:hypothetical protein